MKTYTFRILIEPEEEGGYHGFVPFLPGVHTSGDTLEEVTENLKEAVTCHVQGLVKDGESVPQEEKSIEIIYTFSEDEISLAHS